MNKTLLAIGAHPDDIELGCGGVLRKHINAGAKAYGLVLTKGERGGDPVARVQEATRAAEVIGLTDIVFYDYPDTLLTRDESLSARIEQHVRKIRPSVVYVHTPNDRHQDHVAAYVATRSAARSAPGLLLYETPSTETGFAPKYFEDVTTSFDDKLRALTVFESQLGRKIVDMDAVRTLGRYWAMKTRFVNGYAQHCPEQRYVEAFEIERLLHE